MIRAFAVCALSLSFASPARGACRQAADPGEVTCAKDDVRLWIAARTEAEAATAVEQARVDRLTKELTACRQTQGACQPLPPPDPYPWRDVVAAGAVGVAVGVVAWAVVSLALSR